MTAESTTETDSRTLANRMGWIDYKGQGHMGAPDGLFMKGGRGFTAEFKATKGKQRDSQIKHEALLVSLGVPYYLVWSLDEFAKVILLEEEKLNATL